MLGTNYEKIFNLDDGFATRMLISKQESVNYENKFARLLSEKLTKRK